MSKLVVVGRYSFPHEAHIARASLESAGISASVADEHTINANWLYSQALGGVRLLVSAAQADEAADLLSRDFSKDVEAQFGKELENCPNCGSQNHEIFTKGKLPAFVVFILIGFPLFFYKHGLRCLDCDEFWQT